MKQGTIIAWIGALSVIVAALVTVCLTHWFSKKPEIQVISIAQQIVHIGDESRPDYPDEPDGRRLEATYHTLLPTIPTIGVLYIEAYDLDLIGADILFNGENIGRLKTGDDWQENAFEIPKRLFSKGKNQVLIRSRKWDNGQIEDFLIRNVRLEVRYE